MATRLSRACVAVLGLAVAAAVFIVAGPAAPTAVLKIVAPTSPTRASSLSWKLTFGGHVSGFSKGDLVEQIKDQT